MESSLKMGHVLDLLFRKLGYDKKMREQKAIFLWNEVVGKHVAEHAQPTQIDNGIMSVIVSDSIWLTELNLLRIQYVAKINEELGAKVVKEIDFRVGKVNKPSDRSSSRNIRVNEDYGTKIEDIELGTEELRIISQAVADVEDEELGDILKRIFTNQSKSAKLRNDD